jgi:hypothetical protein
MTVDTPVRFIHILLLLRRKYGKKHNLKKHWKKGTGKKSTGKKYGKTNTGKSNGTYNQWPSIAHRDSQPLAVVYKRFSVII